MKPLKYLGEKKHDRLHHPGFEAFFKHYIKNGSHKVIYQQIFNNRNYFALNSTYTNEKRNIYIADSSVIHINMNSKILKINMHHLTLHEKFNKSRPMGIYPEKQMADFLQKLCF